MHEDACGEVFGVFVSGEVVVLLLWVGDGEFDVAGLVEADDVGVCGGVVGLELCGEEFGGAVKDECDGWVCGGDGDVCEGGVIVPDDEVALGV